MTISIVIDKINSFDLDALKQTKAMLQTEEKTLWDIRGQAYDSDRPDLENEILAKLAEDRLVNAENFSLMLEAATSFVGWATDDIKNNRDLADLNKPLDTRDFEIKFIEKCTDNLTSDVNELRKLKEKLELLEVIAYYATIRDERHQAMVLLFTAVNDKLNKLAPSADAKQTAGMNDLTSYRVGHVQQTKNDDFEKFVGLLRVKNELNNACKVYQSQHINKVKELYNVNADTAKQMLDPGDDSHYRLEHALNPELKSMSKKYETIEHLRFQLRSPLTPSLSERIQYFEKTFEEKKPEIQKHRDTTFFVSHVRRVLNWFASWFGKRIIPSEGRKLADNEITPLINNAKQRGFLPNPALANNAAPANSLVDAKVAVPDVGRSPTITNAAPR